MRKRLLATLLSLCLVVGLFPTAALAVDDESGGDLAPVCACTTLCTEEAINEACDVCKADYSECAYTEPTPPDAGGSEFTPCTATEGCTLADGHEGECVLPDSEPDGTNAINAVPFADEVDGNLDLTDGSIVITSTGYLQGNMAEETPYVGDYTISQNGDDATTNTISVNSGNPIITLNSVNIDVSDSTGSDVGQLCAFSITGGNVTLKLANDSQNILKSGGNGTSEAWNGLTAYAGLWVKDGATLTIGDFSDNNAGSLTATGGVAKYGVYEAGGAGIGGSYILGGSDGAMGDITINSGTIIASSGDKGGRTGAGLGKAPGDPTNSTITINGGTVTATGIGQAAAIGGTYGTQGGEIIITGGTVTATAQGSGAGIGAGNLNTWSVVDIQGGTITAQGGTDAAGIGSGAANFYVANNPTGNIAISGGTVTATGKGYGAGIGGGGSSTDSVSYGGGSNSGNITITGGTVQATGGDNAPGIGSGSFTAAPSADSTAGALDTIKLTGGTITAKNGTSYSGTSISFDNVDTGVGCGANPGSGVDPSDWRITTEYGDALTLYCVEEETTLIRNGDTYTTAAFSISDQTYYLLPEGVYDGLGTDGEDLFVATESARTSAEDLVSKLNSVSLEELTDETIETIQSYETTYYLHMSETQRYYVDTTVNNGYTIADIEEALKEQEISVTVTLDAGGGTISSTSVDVTYGQPFALGVPTKDNYDFVGWYLGDEPFTGEDGTGESWPYLGGRTLTAHWESEISGTGTEDDPYLLQSAANLVALSHMSLGISTGEELALFEEAENVADLLDSHFKLMNDVTLSTSDGFYGIGGRYGKDLPSSGYGDWITSGLTGVFDGNGKTITLAVDTSALADNEVNPGFVNISKDQTNPIYLEITGGLFNNTRGATVKNLTIDGSVKLLVSSAFVGVFAGTAENSVFDGCINNADVTTGAVSNTTWTGGIAGYASEDSAVFKNCTNNGDIFAGAFAKSEGNSGAAGICSYIGATSTTFENCTNHGDLSATRQNEIEDRYSRVAGILSGSAESKSESKITIKITNCANYGDLKATAQSNNMGAGICVTSPDGTLELSGCENYGAITVPTGTGTVGLINRYYDMEQTELSGVTYQNCYHVMSGEGDLSEYKVGAAAATYDKSANQTLLKIPVTQQSENNYIESRYVERNGKKIADICSSDSTQVYNTLLPYTDGGSGSGSGSSSGSTTYAITVESSRHGEVDSSRTRASSGSTVTLTVTPDEGYVLDELTVTDKNGNTVKLTDKGNGKYTFTMPRSAVTVEASFVVEADPDIPVFTDVPADAYYADAVAWAVENGITNGTSATTFGPDVSCTRAQMVTFLWRAAGSPEPTTANNPFTDVQSDAYYYDAVLWAVEQGITSGTSATTFSPDATVTRGQTVTFLWRQAGSPVVNYAMSFADVDAGAYYAEAVRWAVSEGVTAGTSGTTFSPDASCTRAQIVTFLYRDLA